MRAQMRVFHLLLDIVFGDYNLFLHFHAYFMDI